MQFFVLRGIYTLLKAATKISVKSPHFIVSGAEEKRNNRKKLLYENLLKAERYFRTEVIKKRW